MEKKLSHTERLLSVIEWSNMSINVFSRHIGLSRAENLYQIKKGNNGISQKTASMIVEKFPQLSMLWLLTGEGEMLLDNSLDLGMRYFYDCGVEQSIRDVEQLTASDRLVLPSSIDYDLAMSYLGRAMGDRIPTNTTLLLKKISPEMIIPGDECVIVTKKIVILRIAKLEEQCGGSPALRLMAVDRDNFGDVVVDQQDVEAAYVVKGKIIINR